MYFKDNKSEFNRELLEHVRLKVFETGKTVGSKCLF